MQIWATSFYQRFRKYARKKAGLNMKKLADLLGAPYRTVQDWNAGRRMPPDWVQRLIIEKIEANA